MLTLHNATESDFPFYLALKSEDECIKWGGFRNKPDAQKLREVFSERIFSRTNRILIRKMFRGTPFATDKLQFLDQGSQRYHILFPILSPGEGLVPSW